MVQKQLRVMIVTRSLMMGGTQRHIVKLCKELASADAFISVCLLINDEPRDLIDELPSSIKVYISPYQRHDLRTVFWLASVVRHEKSQIVHSFSWHADFYSVLLKILLPRLVVLGSERGDRGAKGFYSPIYQWLDRLVVFRLADGFCANSHFGKRLLITYGCNPQKIEVIPNGVDLTIIDSQPVASVSKIYNWPESSTLCCLVSRLIDYKGIDEFIRVVALCQQDIRFVIIGDGPQRDQLVYLVSELALDDRIVFTGQLNPATPFVKSADICILSTRESTEHCSNSILEYMACAKPVIAMNVAGNAELIISGQTGLLVDPQRVEELASALDELASNKILAQKMGLAGRNRIEGSFQMKNIANKFSSLWQTAAKKEIGN
jgi:L-malate glycosyltransferase